MVNQARVQCLGERSVYFGSLWEACRPRRPDEGESAVFPQAGAIAKRLLTRLTQT